MRRAAVLGSLLVALLVGLVAIGAVAQEATPIVGGAQTQDATPTVGDVTLEVLAVAPPAPGQALTLLRLVLAPGASLPLHTNPGTTALYVDAGALGVTALTGVAEVTRVQTPGTPGALPPATPGADATPPAAAVVETAALVLGAETVLGPGDAVAFGPDLVHGLRNAGTGPAIVLLTGVYADDEAPFQFVELPADGTPTTGTPTP